MATIVYIALQQYKLWDIAFGKSSRISAKFRNAFCADAPSMLTYPYFWKNLEHTSQYISSSCVQFHNKKHFRRLLDVSMQRSLRFLLLSDVVDSSQLLATWRCNANGLLSFIPCILTGIVWVNHVCNLDLYAGSLLILKTHSSFDTDFRRDDSYRVMLAMEFCDAQTTFCSLCVA